MSLNLQDTDFSDSFSLHEALVKSCSSSIGGGGVYAFATATGADLLLGDGEFENMLERGPFHLVIGTDAITDTAAIKKLSSYQDEYDRLTVSAYIHGTINSLFHPKFTFFKCKNDTGKLVIGSGNLTAGGLRKNREAFCVVNLVPPESITVESTWNSWLDESRDKLKNLDDDQVLEKVSANKARKVFRRDNPPIPRQPIVDDEAVDISEPEEYSEWIFHSKSEILFAEIPRSGNRWNQANFDVKTFQVFFGATPGDNSQRILLRHISPMETLGNIEIRPSVSVISKNYRFELEAASGLAYPDEGRPIGIFAKVSTRMFIYRLLMPGDPAYSSVVRWMDRHWRGRQDRMKRIIRPAEDVATIIENTPLQRYSL